MGINSSVFQHYKGYELLIKKLDEAIFRYNKTLIPVEFDFFKPDSIEVIENFLSDRVPYKLIGGYNQAINKKLIIGSDFSDEDYLVCLKGKFNQKFNKLTHSDIKGAIYNCGIDPEKFGDLWIEDDCIYLYTDTEIASYIINNFHKVSRCTIDFEQCEFHSQIFKFDTSIIHVNSLRLDKIVGAIIRKSREKAKALIVDSYVNVNYKTIEDCSFVCHNNDILSIRGFGRFLIGEISSNKRNDNLIIEIKKFV